MAALSTPLQYNCPLSQKKTPLQLACKVRGMTTLSTPSQLVYKVRRNEPELLAPATPTPYELKYLSDIDDQKSLRIQIPIVYFYTNNIVGIGMKKRDPVKVIKEAIAKALVYYYPFAGRLREGRNDKLMVECTGEGVMFIEADADVRLDQLVDDTLKPPFPCMQDLLYNVPGSNNILNCPLLLIQVTRLMCGGFVFALRFNHTVSDGAGLVQFLTAIGEMACGAYAPSIQPLWRRELLNARVPPNISCVQQMYNELQNSNDTIVNDMTLLRSFYFGPQEIEALRNQVDPHLRTTSRFEILTACLWRCRTIALSLNPDDQVSPVVIVNARKIFHPPLPVGFYGNAFGTPVVFSTAGKLCQSPLEYALGLVKKAKAKVTEEFMKSSADFLVKNGRPSIINLARNYMVSDVSRLRFNLDFGWGKAVYGGPTGAFPLETSYYVAYRNKIEDGIVVTVNLPGPAMEKFAVEFEKMIKGEFN